MQKRLPSSLPVTSAFLYYRKLVWSQAEGYLDFLEEFFTSQVSVGYEQHSDTIHFRIRIQNSQKRNETRLSLFGIHASACKRQNDGQY